MSLKKDFCQRAMEPLKCFCGTLAKEDYWETEHEYIFMVFCPECDIAFRSTDGSKDARNGWKKAMKKAASEKSGWQPLTKDSMISDQDILISRKRLDGTFISCQVFYDPGLGRFMSYSPPPFVLTEATHFMKLPEAKGADE